MFASNTSQVANDAVFIEDTFSCTLYTGTGASLTITNGIDLSTKGGLVWIKDRVAANRGPLVDTARGATKALIPSSTAAQQDETTGLTGFTSSGFTLGTNGSYYNGSGVKYASWTFRKQPKFFDVVTYTGNGAASRQIAHNLGSVPGCIILKRTNTATDWWVYHRSTGLNKLTRLNTTGEADITSLFPAVSSTSFQVDAGPDNNTGDTYVAYLFAHNAGGFGLTGTDNVISCGGYAGNGASQTINLGYEAQFVIIKRTSGGTGSWNMSDVMRGMIAPNTSATTIYSSLLQADSSGAENSTLGGPYYQVYASATGFIVDNSGPELNESGSNYIYIAIRRGPMKVPTDATTVFQPVAYTGTNSDNRLVNTGIVTDMTMARGRNNTSAGGLYVADRLRGDNYLGTAVTDAEAYDADSFMTPVLGYGTSFSVMNGFGVGNDAVRQLNQSTTNQLAYAFKRAPNFFDEVCYTGIGTAGATQTHNLGAVPELMIVKRRDAVLNFVVYNSTIGNSNFLVLNLNNAVNGAVYWNNTTPTSTQFTLGSSSATNFTGGKYVAYLFATCPGVSKVGSYTGTGATQTISCGFASGARFVLVKRTDTTGDWYVWDSARGIVSGNDPYLLLNSTAAEVTSTDYIDTYSAGFEISSTAPAAINASGGTFIFLAIA